MSNNSRSDLNAGGCASYGGVRNVTWREYFILSSAMPETKLHPRQSRWGR